MDSSVDEMDSSENDGSGSLGQERGQLFNPRLPAGNDSVLRRLLNSHRIMRDADMLMNSVYWIHALKANNARGIGADLYFQLCESQKFVQEFAAYSINFQKAQFKKLVEEKRKEKEALGHEKSGTAIPMSSVKKPRCKRLDSLVDQLRQSCLEAYRTKTEATAEIDLSLEFFVECTFLTMLDLDDYIGTSLDVVSKLISWFPELEPTILELKKLVEMILNGTRCFKRLINSNRTGSEKPIILTKRQFIWSINQFYLKPFIKHFYKKYDERLAEPASKDPTLATVDGEKVRMIIKLVVPAEQPADKTAPSCAKNDLFETIPRSMENSIKKGNVFKPWKTTAEKFKLLIDIKHNSNGFIWLCGQPLDKSRDSLNQIRFIKEASLDKPESPDELAEVASVSLATRAAVPVEVQPRSNKSPTLFQEKKQPRKVLFKSKSAKNARSKSSVQKTRESAVQEVTTTPTQVPQSKQPAIKRLSTKSILKPVSASLGLLHPSVGHAQSRIDISSKSYSTSAHSIPGRTMDVPLVDVNNNNVNENSCNSMDEPAFSHMPAQNHSGLIFTPNGGSSSSSLYQYGSYYPKTIYPQLMSNSEFIVGSASGPNPWSSSSINLMDNVAHSSSASSFHNSFTNSFSGMHALASADETNQIGIQPTLSSIYNTNCCYPIMHPSNIPYSGAPCHGSDAIKFPGHTSIYSDGPIAARGNYHFNNAFQQYSSMAEPPHHKYEGYPPHHRYETYCASASNLIPSINDFYNLGGQQQHHQMSHVSPSSPMQNSFPAHQAPGTKYYLLSLAPSSLATAIKSNVYNDPNCFAPNHMNHASSVSNVEVATCVDELFNEDLLVESETFQ